MDGIEIVFEADVPARIAAHRLHIYDRIYEAAAELKRCAHGAVKVEIGDLPPKKAQAKAHVAFRNDLHWRLRTIVENGFLYLRKVPKGTHGKAPHI